MSIFHERYINRTRLGRPMPGPFDTGNGDRPPMVAIARGAGYQMLDWFDDPAELAALETAARVQREKLISLIAVQGQPADQQAETAGSEAVGFNTPAAPQAEPQLSAPAIEGGQFPGYAGQPGRPGQPLRTEPGPVAAPDAALQQRSYTTPYPPGVPGGVAGEAPGPHPAARP